MLDFSYCFSKFQFFFFTPPYWTGPVAESTGQSEAIPNGGSHNQESSSVWWQFEYLISDTTALPLEAKQRDSRCQDKSLQMVSKRISEDAVPDNGGDYIM